MTNREIAETLVLGDKAVEHHVTSALAKAGVKNRVLLALWWERKTIADWGWSLQAV